MWEDLKRRMMARNTTHCCLIGDFNCLRSQHETQGIGESSYKVGEAVEFNEFIDDIELIDIPLSYPNFVRGPLLDDMRPFFGPREVLGTHH